jgi:hypothetical protein
MTTTIHSRRKLIVILLLCVAVAGALIRQYTPRGSITHDIGTLLMVMWVPVIGNVIAWLIGKYGKRPGSTAAAPAGPSTFDARGPFTAHARVELTLRPPALPSQDVPITPGEYRGALVLDTEGFSARWFVPPGEVLQRGAPHALEIEFLAPAIAAPRFPRDTVFRVLVGDSFVADGKVLQALSVDA